MSATISPEEVEDHAFGLLSQALGKGNGNGIRKEIIAMEAEREIMRLRGLVSTKHEVMTREAALRDRLIRLLRHYPEALQELEYGGVVHPTDGAAENSI